jgi:hypothetical protein
MVNLIEYIKSIITNFGEEITVVQTSPAVDHLFTVRDELLAKPLLEEQGRAFHHAMTQLLFLSARAQCKIQPATAFFEDMGKMSPDEDDWGNVKRLLGYLFISCPKHAPNLLG